MYVKQLDMYVKQLQGNVAANNFKAVKHCSLIFCEHVCKTKLPKVLQQQSLCVFLTNKSCKAIQQRATLKLYSITAASTLHLCTTLLAAKQVYLYISNKYYTYIHKIGQLLSESHHALFVIQLYAGCAQATTHHYYLPTAYPQSI